MWLKRTAVALFTAFTVTACTDTQPVGTDQLGPSDAAMEKGGNRAEKGAQRAGLLTAIPVQLPEVGDALLSITNLSFENGQLLADGIFTWTQGGTTHTEVFENAPADLSRTAEGASATAMLPGPGGGYVSLVQRGRNEAGVCDILFLDIGAIFLDLLGLTVDLSPIQLDVDAQRGPGNLLGNLLCAVAGLLDGGPLAGIGNLLDRINDILAGATDLLQNIPFQSELLNPDGTTAGTIDGLLSITELSLNDAGQLLASGTLTGTTDAGETVTQTFTTTADLSEVLGGLLPASSTLSRSQAGLFHMVQRAPNETGVCDILFLDLGPIFLDLLGLTVDLSQVVLDIDANRGPGNLLGNLLCALTGLLDGGPLASILQLIDRINMLLDNLSGGLPGGTSA